MLHAIEDAKNGIPYFWFGLSGVNATCTALFLFPLFDGQISTANIMSVIAVNAVIGFIGGLYITFRSTLSSAFGLYGFCYVVIGLELMASSGGVALVAQISGRPDLRWMFFYTSAFCASITLLGSMYFEALKIGAFNKLNPEQWKKEVERYINYSKRSVSPSLSNGQTLNIATQALFKSPYALMGLGSSAIPLFFELYAGGKLNAIYLAAPLMSLTLIYLNFKRIGPGLVRIILLRKLEKSLGYRFINADYEQIQELRRTFFLSRWLMKDYVKPESKTAATNGAVQRK